MEKNEIKIDGVTYVKKGVCQQAAKNKEGLTFCIVRTYSAGVFAGWFDRTKGGDEGTIYDSRRIWYWTGANSLSELALRGTTKPKTCRFPGVVRETDLKGIIEVIPCTTEAKESIESVPEWKHE